MSKKTVAFKMPEAKPVTPEADAWVKDRGGEVVQMAQAPDQPKNKRLTIDISDTLHRRIKAESAMKGLKMADIIRDMLVREFPAE
jgi:predicted DNA binding CopG/RHH family protein